MCSWPTELRGPGVSYQNHKKSLENSEYFELSEITQELINTPEKMKQFDVFWFYTPFEGPMYGHLKSNYPHVKFWMGPNILLDKAELGISNGWEQGFTTSVESDVYCNNSNFYLKRVLQFYKNSKKNIVLKYCMDLSKFEDNSSIEQNEKKFDVLLYVKKRRIDTQFDTLLQSLIHLLESDPEIKYHTIEYGSYKREDFFKKVKESKVTAWISIEDYCSAAQLECQYLDCPIVGTQYNLTDTFDSSYWVDAQTMSDTDWIRWKPDAHIHYYDGIKRILKNYKNISGKPSKFIKQNYNLESYSKYVKSILEEII